MSANAVVSHTSAAVLHGLPVVSGRYLDRVHVTKPRSGGQGRTGRYVHVHGAPIPDSDIELFDGIPVTNLARTVVDSARITPLGPALAIADGALRAGSTTDAWLAQLELLGRRRGVRFARRVAGLADVASESAGESMSRAVLIEQRIPTPSLQQQILDQDGRFVARVDFCWEQERTIGEFDGKIKYGRALRGEQSVEDVLYQEKLREDALRDLGWQVARWIWPDLFNADVIAERIRRAFRRATSV
jgi:very-short-patch-repair endonuclease